MIAAELQPYLDRVRRDHVLAFYLPRFFMAHEEWIPLASDEHYRRHGVFRELYPPLSKVLEHKSVVILGEPGAGKSTVAHAAVLECAGMEPVDSIPLYVSLAGYRGILAELLNKSVGDQRILTERDLEEKHFRRLYVLDGLDEVPPEHLQNAVREIEQLLRTDEQANLLLTSRQAFFEEAKGHFANPPLQFHLLDFLDEDIRSFVEHYGLEYDTFMEEVCKVGFEGEISNPFTLDTAIRYYAKERHLGRTRSQIVSYVIESLIATRPRFANYQQRRALRMLGVALETYARNELTLDEARRVLSESMRLDTSEVDELLQELGHSILVRADDKISFQMRSYGEYMAAEELGDASLERVQGLIFLENTRIPGESWGNTLGYVVEINKEVRRYFLLHHPRFALRASPAVLTEEEGTQFVGGILGELARNGEYLINHPLIPHRTLARHVTDASIPRLIEEAGSGEPVRIANALVLLAHRKVRDGLEQAITLALDRSQMPLLRRSAVAAVANIGDSSLIPRLFAALDQTDPMHLSIVDCIGGLTDEQTIPVVLPLLLRTDAMVSGAFNRFREFHSREAIVVTLDYLLGDPQAITSRRIDSYLGPIWRLLDRFWDPEIAERLGRLFALWEQAHIHEGTMRDIPVITEIVSRRDAEGLVACTCLTELLHRGERVRHLADSLARIMTVETARWLVGQERPQDFASLIAFRSRREIREILEPRAADIARSQEEYAAEFERAERERTTAAQRVIEEHQQTVANSDQFPQVLNALGNLDPTHWPELPEERREWLRVEVSRHFLMIDCAKRIVWESENRFSVPHELPVLLDILNRYRLKLDDDVPLIQSLLGWTAKTHIQYYKLYSLSDAAKQEFDRLLADTTLPIGAVPRFLEFLDGTKYCSPSVLESLARFADSAALPEHLRTRSVGFLDKNGVPDEQLVQIAERNQPPVNTEALDRLVIRQHRPTIERRLAALLNDDNATRAGEVDFAEDMPFEWIYKVRTPEVWDRLAALRARALKLNLPRVVGHVTRVLERIDLTRLAALIREQMRFAPPGWRDTELIRAIECERNARLQKAQETSFDNVLMKMTTETAMKRFKIWCEGPTDNPVYESFVKKLAGPNTTQTVVQSVGGWNNLLNVNWDFSRMWDGCRDLILVMDGDKGREMNNSARPLSQNGINVQARLAAVRIDLRVLLRYGVENYFPRHVMESVIGRDLSRYFPLPEDRAVEAYVSGFSKQQNRVIAERMTLDDLRGTDLLEILEEVRNRTRL